MESPLGQVAPAATSSTHVEQFEFRGSGGEYFRIWIVNLALSILTLGIYSAWAKVRRLKYFYGNTVLAGSPFGYHAEPLKILKGRLIAVALFVVYSVAGEISALLGAIAGVALFFAIPWIVVRSRIFMMRMSSYRNVRFGFERNYGGAFRTYVLSAFGVALTLGALFPWWVKRRWDFTVENSRFGQTPFVPSFRTGAFFALYAKGFFVLLGGLLVVLLLGAGLVATGLVMLPDFGEMFGNADTAAAAATDPGAVVAMVFAGYLLVIPAFIAFGAYVRKHVLNTVYGNTAIGPHRLRSTLQFRWLFWLYLSNAVMVIVTAGLFIPWAHVRLARYRAECIVLEVQDSLDGFIAAEQEAGTATGDEVGDFFDVDLGL